MTAFVAYPSAVARPGSPRPIRRASWVVALVILLVATIAVSASHHATWKHGNDAVRVRECLRQNGPGLVFQSVFNPDKFYLGCKLGDGRWGLQVVEWDRVLGRWIERTAFVKGNGSFGALVRYLGRFAVRFVGVLPH